LRCLEQLEQEGLTLCHEGGCVEGEGELHVADGGGGDLVGELAVGHGVEHSDAGGEGLLLVAEVEVGLDFEGIGIRQQRLDEVLAGVDVGVRGGVGVVPLLAEGTEASVADEVAAGVGLGDAGETGVLGLGDGDVERVELDVGPVALVAAGDVERKVGLVVGGLGREQGRGGLVGRGEWCIVPPLVLGSAYRLDAALLRHVSTMCVVCQTGLALAVADEFGEGEGEGESAGGQASHGDHEGEPAGVGVRTLAADAAANGEGQQRGDRSCKEEAKADA